MKSININDYVKFKPKNIEYYLYENEQGRIRYGEKQNFQFKVDENGYCKMQIHEFIKQIEPLILMGCPTPILDNLLYFEDDDLEDMK